MLLKAVGQQLGTATKEKECRWEMPKGYWKASGQFLKGIVMLLGNGQISATSQWGLVCPGSSMKGIVYLKLSTDS
jgi:hypothetical protein